METIRTNSVRFVGLSALALSTLTYGCAVDAPTGEAASKSQEIWGAADDANTLEANVIVHLGNCSGTLITPRIVLTAAHCTYPSYLPEVRFGNDHTQFVNLVPSTRVVAHPDYQRDDPNAPHYSEYDIALVYLSEPVFDRAKIHRPSLVAPTNFDSIGMAGWSSCGRNINYSNPNQTKRQAAIFVDGVYQSQTGPDELALRNQPNFGAAIWTRDSENTGVCSGDSGGALFVAHADGTRETFGVTSWVSFFGDGTAIGAGWADVTTEAARNWILSQVRDSSVRGPRSAAWLSAHGKSADTFWFGEADYTGTCDESRDSDCDYWYAEHDNAPTVYNPDQYDDSEPEPEPTPCSDLCANPVQMTSQYFGSGQMGSQATCHETTFPVNGLTCGNLAPGRQLSINGQTVACGSWIQIPPARNGGYCVQTNAGGYDWAFFQTW
ncbi:MAG TPA: trypsin-like serine protease [Polyangiaceae bacterium]|nr:trypsin-like serine protease [Polyangiaceae bacterium]